jgi:UDP-GlcNAc:undecaprenyl-phosphate GlcNAc-1-phosphate transferase
VLILWAWTAVLSGFVLYPLFGPRANAVIPFGVIALGLALYTLFLPVLPGQRKYALDVEEDDEGPLGARPWEASPDSGALDASAPEMERTHPSTVGTSSSSVTGGRRA